MSDWSKRACFFLQQLTDISSISWNKNTEKKQLKITKLPSIIPNAHRDTESCLRTHRALSPCSESFPMSRGFPSLSCYLLGTEDAHTMERIDQWLQTSSPVPTVHRLKERIVFKENLCEESCWRTRQPHRSEEWVMLLLEALPKWERDFQENHWEGIRWAPTAEAHKDCVRGCGCWGLRWQSWKKRAALEAQYTSTADWQKSTNVSHGPEVNSKDVKNPYPKGQCDIHC